jgi:hypothetical protein
MNPEVIAQAKVVLAAIMGKPEFVEELRQAKTPGEIAAVFYKALGSALPEKSKNAKQFALHDWWGTFYWTEDESAILLLFQDEREKEETWRWN